MNPASMKDIWNIITFCYEKAHSDPGLFPSLEYRLVHLSSVMDYRDDCRQGFYLLWDFVMDHEQTIDLLDGFIDRNDAPTTGGVEESLIWLDEQPIVSWLDEHCPNHRRVGPLVGFNDENEMFLWRMRWA